jgi:hypothetical protein
MRGLGRAGVDRIPPSPFGRRAARRGMGVNRGSAQSEDVVRSDSDRGRKGRTDAKERAALKLATAKGVHRDVTARILGDTG